MNGETDKIVHNGKEYDLSSTKFKHYGHPVYILSINDVPKYFYYLLAIDKLGGYHYRINTCALVDKDQEFFDKYGWKEA